MAAPAPRFNWTGAYAGAGLGYGRMSFDTFDSRNAPVGGLFGGYRYDTGNVVYGGELTVSPGAFGSATLPGGDELKSGASLMLSAGIPFTESGRTLGYVAAGPTLLRTDGAAGSDTSTGLGAQLGVDHMLTDQIMLRGSVTYTVVNDLGSTGLDTDTLGAGLGVAFKF
jgi:opacity protein-like surface antigen